MWKITEPSYTEQFISRNTQILGILKLTGIHEVSWTYTAETLLVVRTLSKEKRCFIW